MAPAQLLKANCKHFIFIVFSLVIVIIAFLFIPATENGSSLRESEQSAAWA